MGGHYRRREWMRRVALGTGFTLAGLGAGMRPGSARSEELDGERLARETLDFIVRCRRPDGGYAPSPDPGYAGRSDTALSDLAAVTYAAVLARTMGRELPDARRSAEYIHRRQQPDGRFVHVAGRHDPESDLAILYNTTQGVVYRHIGAPTPEADRMVARVLRDQKPGGGWDNKEPDWDVHAGFDAVFILRQLGGDAPKVRKAIARGADWALRCRNADGGFGHFPGQPSDLDAVYFQFGTLIMAGRVPGVRRELPDAHTLGWGRAMQPGRYYRNTPPDRT